jgi:integrase/recombinase XerC
VALWAGLAVAEYLERKGRRSVRTRTSYVYAMRELASALSFESADGVIAEIKGGRLDPYVALDRYVAYLMGRGLAPKTVLTYVSAVKGLFGSEDIVIDSRILRNKVELPAKMEVSIDRIPTREEIRSMLLNSDKRTRALISLLATSGLRIGEAAALCVGNLELFSNKIVLSSPKSKSRQRRVTFITDETAGFIRDYLGPTRILEKGSWLFQKPGRPEEHSTTESLYMDVRRILQKTGLLARIEPDSKRNQLHPHSFRKYFFSKLIGAGVDRGIAEHFMGHSFGLDNAYLHLSEDEMKKAYEKVADDFTFLTDRRADKAFSKENEELRSNLEKVTRDLATLKGQFETALKGKIMSS